MGALGGVGSRIGRGGGGPFSGSGLCFQHGLEDPLAELSRAYTQRFHTQQQMLFGSLPVGSLSAQQREQMLRHQMCYAASSAFRTSPLPHPSSVYSRESIHEMAARLLFSIVSWIRQIPSFGSLTSYDQVECYCF